MIIVYVKDIALNSYRMVTYGEVKRALESDIAYQSDTYITGAPTIYQNLPDGIRETNPADSDYVTFDCGWVPILCNGLCHLGLEFKTEESATAPTAVDILRSELTVDPLYRGYAEMTAEQKLTSLNTKNRPWKGEYRFVTFRTLMAEIDPVMVATIYAKVQAAAEANPVMGLGLSMLTTYSEGGGIDVVHPNTQAFISSLSGTVLTAEEVAAVIGLAYTSRANELINRAATADDITAATA